MSKEFLGFRKLVATGASVACAAFAGGLAEQASARSQELGDQCRPYAFNPAYKSGEYIACIAYTIDAVGYQERGTEYGGLTPYYGFGSSSVSEINAAVTKQFKSRYWLSARTELAKRVASWPAGENFVDNRIEVKSLRVDPIAKRAIINTTESWLVFDVFGNVKYLEDQTPHASTMCQISAKGSKKLRDWVVVANTAQQDFDCDGFSRQVALGEIR